MTSLLGAARGEAAPAAAPGCATAGLVVWLETQGSGAAGSIYYELELTNLSHRACTLRGYPGVSAVDLAGRQVGSAAGRDAAHGARTVTLARGASATVTLQLTDVDNFPASACGKVEAAGLRVYPPNETASARVPFPFSACGRSGPVYIHVEAVEPFAAPSR